MPQLKKLDDKSYDEICARAKASISEYCVDWTDQNVHDPGITLIELFSWLTEMQRFYIEQRAEFSLLAGLFGARPHHASPAVARAELYLEKSDVRLALPAGVPVLADDTRFELTAPMVIYSEARVILRAGDLEWDGTGSDTFHPFGAPAQSGNFFEILMRIRPASGRFVIFVQMPQLARNEMLPDDIAFLSSPRWEYMTENGYIEINPFDRTCGFLVSGDIEFYIDEDFFRDARGFYSLRCTLLSHEYDCTPAFTGLRINSACFEQRSGLCQALRLSTRKNVHTAKTYLAINGENMLFSEKDGVYERVWNYEKTIDRREAKAIFSIEEDFSGTLLLVSCEMEYLHHRVLGTALGFPNQRFKIETGGQAIIYDDFEILISESFELSRAVMWKKTDSLHRSAPEDRHYELDEQTGYITFGDGFRGRMPKGVVFIASLSITKGSRGNIKAGGLESFSYAGYEVYIKHQNHAEGGRDKQSEKEALKRAYSENRRVVTALDYEEAVKSTPGLIIEHVAAFIQDGADTVPDTPVTIAVKPYGARAELSKAYKKRILEWLEPRRLAGTRISVQPPVYVNIRLTAELSARTYWTDKSLVIEGKLRSFFSEKYGGFGALIRYGDVLAFLDSLPEVVSALSLRIRADGAGAVADSSGNIVLERQCIASLEQTDIILSPF